MTVLDYALHWKKLKIATIPIRYRDKCPAISTWQEFQTRLPSYTELVKWFSKPFVNLGVVTGWRNLVVVDFDNYTEYERWELWLSRRSIYRWMRQTLQVKTARGVHVYVMTAEPAQNAKLPGIDVKAHGGYVLAPPSIHPSGARYEVLRGDLPIRVEALSDILPAELLSHYTEYAAIVSSSVSVISAALTANDTDPWGNAEQVFDPNQDLIEQIKTRYRIENFFRATQHRGRWQMTHCPFHDDKKPSFWIDINRQLCGCFSGCTTRPYDVIDLYARLHNLSVPEAIRMMRLKNGQ